MTIGEFHEGGGGTPIEARAVGELLNHSTVEHDKERSLAEMKQAAAYQDWKDDQGNALAATVVQGAGTITRRALTLTLTNGTRFDKTYDGKANVTKTLAKGTDNLLSA